MKIKIYNGHVITTYRIIRKGSILISENKITTVTDGDINVKNAMQIVARGNYISPGFIDMHVHGGGGHSFMDGSVEGFLKIAETHSQFGTTSMSPTTLPCSEQDLLTAIKCYKEVIKNNFYGAQFIGMHLEGPYLTINQCGAQAPHFIRAPDVAEYENILSHSDYISRWSAAPELKGGMEFVQYLRSKNILAAIAHTDAIYEEVLKAFENGYTLLTHFYSAVSGITRRNAFRYAGVIESGYLIEEMDVEIIADGVHLPASLLKLIYKIKGVGKTAFNYWFHACCGYATGESILGNLNKGLKVIVEDGVAKLPDRSGFAGSVATTDSLVWTMVNIAGNPLIDAIQMITSTPARMLKISEQKGSRLLEKDADFVIFDENINIETTIVNGKIVYQAERK